jgi:transcriptional regulator with XRE-family HTH domain
MPSPRPCNIIDIPSIIKHIRKKKKLSQAKLGKRVGVHDRTISAYEQGRIKPSLEVFLNILNVGGYSLQLIENIYKTPKELLLPTSEEDNINNDKHYKCSN